MAKFKNFGRPPSPNRYLRQSKTLQLEIELVIIAKKLGDGNFTEGVRRSLLYAAGLKQDYAFKPLSSLSGDDIHVKMPDWSDPPT